MLYRGTKKNDDHDGSETLQLGRAGNDYLRTDTFDFAAIYGGRGDDDLYAMNSAGALLVGGRGDDRLHGGNGNDLLKGGKGDDILDGRSGLDTLKGGKGKDTFFAGPDNHVTIKDFKSGVDHIVLEDSGPGGDFDFSDYGYSGKGHHALKSQDFDALVTVENGVLSFDGVIMATIGSASISYSDILIA